MHEWLEHVAERLAAWTGDDPQAYALSFDDAHALLDLARVAAHDSGARTNAPLACYLVGLAHARRGGDVGDLVEAALGRPPNGP